MRIVIVTPPFLMLTGTAAAPPVLTAVLREAGHEAIPFDVNRFCISRLLTGEVVQASLSRFSSGQEPSSLTSYVRKILPAVIEESVRVLRSEEAYRDFDLYRRARLDVELAMQTHARAHGRSVWSSVQYIGDHDQSDPHELLAAIQRGDEVFDPALGESIQCLLEAQPDLVALSVSVPGQLYGALRLAYLIREQVPQVHICLGGATVTRLRRAYPHLPELFNIVDSIILREGEVPIVTLAHTLNAGAEPLNHVEGLVARRDGIVVQTGTDCDSLLRLGMPARRKSPLPLNKMPFPVFEDLVPGPYLSPGPLLPVSTTRNCYYDKCEFCAIGRSFNHGYDEMPASRMVEQVEHLTGIFPTALFKDVSEALPPRLSFDFAVRLARHGEAPSWEAYLRFEPPFASAEAANRLYRGGLRVALFGLESASPGLVGEMNKRIDIDQAERTIRYFAEAGIWVHLFLMSGYARETEADHEATLNFLRRNAQFIRSIQGAAFAMELDSNIVELSQRYRFVPKKRYEPSFSLTMPLEQFGDIPPPEVAQQRVREIRQVAYGKCGPDLAASRHVWDAHKLFFHVRDVQPSLREANNPHPAGIIAPTHTPLSTI